MLRETHHRSSNDLQLVVGLLSLQSRRATNPDTRGALAEAMGRIAVLAQVRADLNQRRPLNLEGVFRQVCEALHSQAEPRSILVSMQAQHDKVQGLVPDHISTLALVMNQLATNASKHAFHKGKSGHIGLAVWRDGERQDVTIVVNSKWLIITLQTDAPTTQIVEISLLRRHDGDWFRVNRIRSRRSR